MGMKLRWTAVALAKAVAVKPAWLMRRPTNRRDLLISL
jgi:hypothetical protein